MRLKLILTLAMLVGATVTLLPTATADCSGMCIEDCEAVVRTGQVGAGCYVAHDYKGLWTNCIGGDCGNFVVTCQAFDGGQYPNCDVYSLGSIVDPDCHQIFVGPDIDQGLCYDLDGDCRVWWYDTYGTGGGDRCYI